MVGVDVSCSGFMEAGSRRSLGFRLMASSMGVLPLKVTCVFLTVGAFRTNWAGAIGARMVWSTCFEAVSTSAKGNFLSARVYVVLLEFFSRCPFGGMHACREDGGKPYLHKSLSVSSGTCPSTHETLQ